MEQYQTSLQDVPHAILAAETDVGDDPRRPEASQAACERCGDLPLGALLLRTGDFHKQQRSAHSLTVRGLIEQLFGLYIMSVEPFVLRAPGALASLAPSTKLCPRGPPRQLVEAKAEDAHGPRDVRGAVFVARQPARILDLQGRELHGRRFVHGALARWISDGFDDSSPCVGHTSRALALMIGCERAIGKTKLDTEQTHLRHTPHDTNTKGS